MADSTTSKKLMRARASFMLRYGLAFASVAGALSLDLLFRNFNLPHPFCCTCTVRNRDHVLVQRHQARYFGILLSSIIPGFIFEGETSSLFYVLYELVFLTLAIVRIGVRRNRALEFAITKRTALPKHLYFEFEA